MRDYHPYPEYFDACVAAQAAFDAATVHPLAKRDLAIKKADAEFEAVVRRAHYSGGGGLFAARRADDDRDKAVVAAMRTFEGATAAEHETRRMAFEAAGIAYPRRAE